MVGIFREILASQRPSRATIGNSGSIALLSIDTTARGGKCQTPDVTNQWPVY